MSNETKNPRAAATAHGADKVQNRIDTKLDLVSLMGPVVCAGLVFLNKNSASISGASAVVMQPRGAAAF